MSARRFSVTLSEDDLRPHMRKPKPKPEISEIQELQKKAEKREETKREVKKRVEEEERERVQRKRDEEIRRETRELLAIRDVVSQDNNRNAFPKLGRRFNNFQYFRWDSDEAIPVIPEERQPTVISPAPSGNCELCTLALRSLDKSGMATKSAACAHVDAFLASSSFSR
uniref:Coiled-coil domain-containing protein 137 n=1 Tax=Caenorhabditis tropicalis TaxID=1561998 RepID=A0A1I7UUZ7_9PELO